MNEDDSEQIAATLMQMGCAPTCTPAEADIAVLVTCSVRSKPEEKAKSKLGELAALKKIKPDMVIGVYGCMGQRLGDSLKKRRPYLDFVLGTGALSRLPQILAEVRRTSRFSSDLDFDDCENLPKRVSRQGSALKSFVTVMYGCSNFCSYCIVPFVRGQERSRTVDDIISELRDLAASGRKEVTLLGQNVNSYGANFADGTDFADLLRAASKVEGIERIRFTTSHPKDLSDRLIDAIHDLPKVCEHIHLPVQSGDDVVLSRMNRHYTADYYRCRVLELRQAVPGIAITTDFLVGFPGETQQQFDNTIRLAEEIRFDSAFMFAFDAIPGTQAAHMTGQLSRDVKTERLNTLIALQNRITCEINDSQVGQSFQVLVEGVSPKDPNRLTGLTRQNKTVNFPKEDGLAGNLIDIEVTEGHLYGFVGRRKG